MLLLLLSCFSPVDSVRPCGLQPTRLLHLWDFPGKSTGVSCQELMLLNSGVGEDSWESLGLQGVQPVNPKEINREYSLEGLMLKLQYFGHLMQRTKSLEKTLMLGKIEDKRRRGQQDEMIWSHHQLNGHEFEQALGVDDGQGRLACCSPWGHKESDMSEQLNW